MNKAEIETVIKTEEGLRVSASNWDEGGAWLHLRSPAASMSAVLTRDEAQRLVAGLQAILNVGMGTEHHESRAEYTARMERLDALPVNPKLLNIPGYSVAKKLAHRG